MPLNTDTIRAGASGASGTSEFYTTKIDQSLRLNNDNGYMDRQFTTPTSAQKMIIATWFKPSDVGTTQHILGGGSSVTNYFALSFAMTGFYNSTSQLKFFIVSGNTSIIQKITNVTFRDVHNWMHICVAIDTTQATADNRVVFFFNGKRYDEGFSGTNHTPDQNENLVLLNANTVYHQIGLLYTGGGYGYTHGYLADYYFLDGQSIYSDTSATINSTFLEDANTLSTFCIQKNGVGIPAFYTGADSTYGNNGFRLTFSNGSALGEDATTNAHNFTTYSMTSTDKVLDSPSNNFATMSYIVRQSSGALFEGALNAILTGGGNSARIGSTFGLSSGKWYWEVRQNSSNRFATGVFDYDKYVFANEDGGSDAFEWVLITDDNSGASARRNNGTMSTGYGGTVSSGQVIMVALDVDNGAIWFGKQGSWFNNGTSDNSATVLAQIIAGTTTNAAYTSVTGTLTPCCVRQTSNNDLTFNFGQDSTFHGGESAASNTDGNSIGQFQYAPPTGFLAVCSHNLPSVTIGPNSTEQADDHFNSFLYTGTGATNRNLALNTFTPDWVWLKARSQTDNHVIIDSSRVTGTYLDSSAVYPNLHTNTTDGEASDAHPKLITNGVQVSGGLYDNNGVTFVVWNWKANGGSLTTNDASSTGIGTIDSVFQANDTAGFSIVTYTGTGTAGTVRHGLSKKPSWVIIKNRTGASVPNWVIGQDAYTAFTGQQYFDADVFGTNSGSFNNTAPTTSVVSIGTDSTVNQSTKTYVMYCFANVEGFSKIGSYNGNSDSDGTFIYTGFKPAFALIKTTTVASQYWILRDNKRDVFNDDSNGSSLYANTSDSEGTGNIDLDFLSNGIKMRDNGSNTNGSGTYIYLAFAENPFKFSNGR